MLAPTKIATSPPAILDGKVICTCFGVTEEEIERVTRENNLTAVEQVTNYCKAGGGCGNCKKDIEIIIERVRKEREAAARDARIAAGTDERERTLASAEFLAAFRKLIESPIALFV